MALKPTGVLMRGVVHNELGTDSKHAISQKIVTDELNKKVPTARKINGKPLTGDVTLTAADVGALTAQGNAATVTKLQTPRTINGTNFDGSANITTANWGTARNITIGNTTKSVNGAADVSWDLDEIGLGGVENKKWVFIKDGAVALKLANGTNVYRGAVNTGLKTNSRTFDQSRYRVVLVGNGPVQASNSGEAWWSCRGEVVPRQSLTAGNQLWIDVWCSGNSIQNGFVTNYAIYEWK